MDRIFAINRTAERFVPVTTVTEPIIRNETNRCIRTFVNHARSSLYEQTVLRAAEVTGQFPYVHLTYRHRCLHTWTKHAWPVELRRNSLSPKSAAIPNSGEDAVIASRHRINQIWLYPRVTY